MFTGLAPNGLVVRKRDLQIIAHQDDDLYFMTPAVARGIESGEASWSVYITAGDAGLVPANYNEGLPVGVQVVGRRFREDLILDALQVVEERVGVMAERLWG